MRRREFITLLGGAATWPLAASAQQADQVRRVGVLSNIAESDLEAQSMVAALHEELRKLGWVNGRNLQIDHRWAAGNAERAARFAKELVALKPDVIVAHTTPSVVAMQKQTDTIPIVFVQISDPIGGGFITNLARPDGNITGFTNFESNGRQMGGIAQRDGAGRLAGRVSVQSANGSICPILPEPLEISAPSLGLKPLASPVQDARDRKRRCVRARAGGGLIVMPDSFNIVHRNQIMALRPTPIADYLSLPVHDQED